MMDLFVMYPTTVVVTTAGFVLLWGSGASGKEVPFVPVPVGSWAKTGQQKHALSIRQAETHFSGRKLDWPNLTILLSSSRFLFVARQERNSGFCFYWEAKKWRYVRLNHHNRLSGGRAQFSVPLNTLARLSAQILSPPHFPSPRVAFQPQFRKSAAHPEAPPRTAVIRSHSQSMLARSILPSMHLPPPPAPSRPTQSP
jgi:hypothetical protein